MDDTPRPRRRNLRERQPVALRPSYVSQHTAPSILGFATARAYLEWLATSGCRVIARGRDRLVRLDDAERAIDAMGPPAADVEPAAAHDEISSVDDVLARIGRRKAS